MSRIAIALIVLLAACGSSTAPSKAGDPSILVTNEMPSDWVYVTWRDGQGIVGRDSVAPKVASQCIRFLAQPDSASWTIAASQTYPEFNETVHSEATAPWFNPSSRPAWHITVTPGTRGGSPAILELENEPPC